MKKWNPLIIFCDKEGNEFSRHNLLDKKTNVIQDEEIKAKLLERCMEAARVLGYQPKQ